MTVYNIDDQLNPLPINEQKIEYGFIGELQGLKYVYRDDIRDRHTLEHNFRQKFEALNRVHLSDSEFQRLKDEIINPDVFISSKMLRTNSTFIREDNTPLHYSLINIKDWCKNEFEVINQLRINTENAHHRYDVILLLNGIPIVQIELKTLQVSPRRAMEQIVNYKNDTGNGYSNTLLCFIQLFIVSNHTNTFYFTNNRKEHFAFSADEQFLPVYQFADRNNKKITNLSDFSKEFLAKCKLSKMISQYMVIVESEQKLLIMRPYQIFAVQDIVNSIKDNKGNGYIWHTTGSGKTLTSFKASTLLKENPDIEKCLFVVDRKDLDRQTREEFNKFQEGCVEENTNVETMVRRMLSNDLANKVIVTTIQKLGIALDPSNQKAYKERLKPLSEKRVVFIFDECHRSQFGENHKAIKEFFPKAQLFGFTGTPIFEENSNNTRRDNEEASYVTTKDIFENDLHAYTITNAIEDKNVLRFHIDYFKPKDDNIRPGEGIAQAAVVEAILQKHDASTNLRRFNALLATQSINDAINYFKLFKEIQERKKGEDFIPLNIACVFSPPAEGNNDVLQLQNDLITEKQDNKIDPEGKKIALRSIIADYNQQYGTNHNIGEFDLYYKDVQQRIKNHKWSVSDFPRRDRVDITIVVDMLLTGFDSKYLNTLYVDKNLKHHGLIQAFSRTNRVLNDTKPYGNILDFRQQQEAVNSAISLFSGEEYKERSKEIWLVDPAPVVIKQYEAAVQRLESFMKNQGLESVPEEVQNLNGDAARAGFIDCFKDVQRFRTQLDQYTDLKQEEASKLERLLSTDQMRAYKGAYLEIAKRLRDQRNSGQESKNEEVEKLDFEFVLFASAMIDYDYIMGLMASSTDQTPLKQKMTREQVVSLLSSSANLMDEAEDLADYFVKLPTDQGYSEVEIREGFYKFKKEKENKELVDISAIHSLESNELITFVDGILNRKIFDSEALGELLAPLELGWKARAAKEKELMADLIPLLKKMAQGREISGLAAYE